MLVVAGLLLAWGGVALVWTWLKRLQDREAEKRIKGEIQDLMKKKRNGGRRKKK